ncbi:hypothetical protein EVAR_71635_1 [Eumeta japonica]|uniref:Uncharacterized protein n=1 Tax=Eumeta variegata TaxID=151549 RepID=A0A4C1SVK9_EUMVA|nr:hypothetical protein EVAR_71635_1 [Eumeta japonica]
MRISWTSHVGPNTYLCRMHTQTLYRSPQANTRDRLLMLAIWLLSQRTHDVQIKFPNDIRVLDRGGLAVSIGFYRPCSTSRALRNSI